MKRKPKPLKRKVHINGQEWSYLIGVGFARIRNPDCSRTWVVPLTKLFDADIDNIYNLRRDGVDFGGPAAIKNYIVSGKLEI